MQQRLEKRWAEYQAIAVPSVAGATQISETRKAFFSGAASLYYDIVNSIADEANANAIAHAADMMADYGAELNEFRKEVLQAALRELVDAMLNQAR